MSPTGADAAVPAAISLINFQVSSFTCSYTKQWVGQLPNIHAIRVTLNHTAAVGEQKKKKSSSQRHQLQDEKGTTCLD